jgi:hypothetical protein
MIYQSQGCAKANQPKGMDALDSVYDRIMEMLEQKMPVSLGEWTAAEVEIIKENFHIITTKVNQGGPTLGCVWW